MRGNERSGSQSFAYPNIDPCREVRTPERNYGPAQLPGGAVVTPLARRLAAERGIDLAASTAPARMGASSPRMSSRPRRAAAGRALATGPSADEIKAIYRRHAVRGNPARRHAPHHRPRLTEAKQTVPHFYLTTDIDLDTLLTLREEANAAARKDADGEPAFKLSINDFIIKALGWRCNACRPPMRCGRRTASCASSNPISALRWRSTAGC